MTALVLRLGIASPPLVLAFRLPDGEGLMRMAEQLPSPASATLVRLDSVEPPGRIRLLAAEAIGGHRGAWIGGDGQVRLADCRTVPDGAQIGITTHAAEMGEGVSLAVAGALEEAGWNWACGGVWLGEDGALVQSPPASGSLVLLGSAAGATRIVIQPRLVARL
jgi:hypothetical protein